MPSGDTKLHDPPSYDKPPTKQLAFGSRPGDGSRQCVVLASTRSSGQTTESRWKRRRLGAPIWAWVAIAAGSALIVGGLALLPVGLHTSDSASSSDGSTNSTAQSNPTTTTPSVPQFQSDMISLHNALRKTWSAGDVSWSTDLEASALSWAKRCVWKHSGGALGPYGENLAAAGSSMTTETTPVSAENAFQGWADEASAWSSGDQTPSHFTQVVWKETTKIGCAYYKCSPLDIMPSFVPANFTVCEYSPQGNVINSMSSNVGPKV